MAAENLESIFKVTAEAGCCSLPLVLITYLALGLDTGLSRPLLGLEATQSCYLPCFWEEPFSVFAFLCFLL